MRKAQAALEFLTTYGWALLVILVMIGALVYFGVLNPQRVLPPKCEATAGFSCKEFRITETTVDVVLSNKLGEAITGLAINGVTSSDFVNAMVAADCQIEDSAGAAITTAAADTDFTVACTQAGPDVFANLLGERVAAQFDIGYQKVRGTLAQTASVSVFGPVQ